MKKGYYFLGLSSLLLLSSVTIGCNKNDTLLLLNWGEYINDDVVAQFEEQYNCRVIISYAESNELFYQKVKSGTTVYDLVIPSEYMVEKMIANDLLQKFDFTKINPDGQAFDRNIFLPGLNGIVDQLCQDNPEFDQYIVPYFWGTFGLMYNKRKAGLEEAVQSESWATIFEKDKAPANTRVGMYNIPRYAYAASLLYAQEQQDRGIKYIGQDIGPNLSNDESYNLSSKILNSVDFKWGTDTLKHDIGSDNLDLAFCYTGDFFDVLYAKLEGDEDYLDHPLIGIHVPERTIAFVDSFVLTKKARHVDLAHKFVEFFLNADMAYENASIIGYCTPLIESLNMIKNGDDEVWKRVVTEYPYNPVPEGSTAHVGTPLKVLDTNFLTKLTIMVNNSKVTK